MKKLLIALALVTNLVHAQDSSMTDRVTVEYEFCSKYEFPGDPDEMNCPARNVTRRLKAFKNSTIVSENVKSIELGHAVECSDGNVYHGIFDSQITSKSIFSTVCSNDTKKLKVKIIGKDKKIKELGSNLYEVEFRLKKVLITNQK